MLEIANFYSAGSIIQFWGVDNSAIPAIIPWALETHGIITGIAPA